MENGVVWYSYLPREPDCPYYFCCPAHMVIGNVLWHHVKDIRDIEKAEKLAEERAEEGYRRSRSPPNRTRLQTPPTPPWRKKGTTLKEGREKYDAQLDWWDREDRERELHEQFDPDQLASQPHSQDDYEPDLDEVEIADALWESTRDPASRGTYIDDHPDVNPWRNCG